ncbi:MAG: hypothetical protein CTY34_06640 [Methylobacter sp.]|nr:MAG: hypothetical protein CTY34_06640 [Methylobacter sp.]PPD24232.1 MAG: hypothetical protein CTY24_01675 [Methylobacter sp.]PPD37599.1 MAG: hypothetical protein CTY18_01415 [Methylomonas sp.]
MNRSLKFLLLLAVIGLSLPVQARVSMDEAVKRILQQGPNRVLGAQMEVIDGRDVYVIKVLTSDGRVIQYVIDAETGETLN